MIQTEIEIKHSDDSESVSVCSVQIFRQMIEVDIQMIQMKRPKIEIESEKMHLGCVYSGTGS